MTAIKAILCLLPFHICNKLDKIIISRNFIMSTKRLNLLKRERKSPVELCIDIFWSDLQNLGNFRLLNLVFNKPSFKFQIVHSLSPLYKLCCTFATPTSYYTLLFHICNRKLYIFIIFCYIIDDNKDKGALKIMENTFGKRLKELREEHELTMDYVVLDMQHKYNIEINKGQLSRWERGQSPSLIYVKYLAMYYNVSADYLLGLTDSKKPSAKINTLVAMMQQEHASTNVDEVRDIIEQAMENANKKALKKEKRFKKFDIEMQPKQA